MDNKHCPTCKNTKSISGFYKNRSTVDGLSFACRDCHNEHVKKYRNKYPSKEKKRSKTSQLNHLQKLKLYKKIIFANYGNKCACCQLDDERFFTIDHVNNDGKKDRHVPRGVFYKRIINLNYPPEYRILCWNCNCARQVFGICPHKMNKD